MTRLIYLIYPAVSSNFSSTPFFPNFLRTFGFLRELTKFLTLLNDAPIFKNLLMSIALPKRWILCDGNENLRKITFLLSNLKDVCKEPLKSLPSDDIYADSSIKFLQ
jgi:hypothetical protein